MSFLGNTVLGINVVPFVMPGFQADQGGWYKNNKDVHIQSVMFHKEPRDKMLENTFGIAFELIHIEYVVKAIRFMFLSTCMRHSGSVSPLPVRDFRESTGLELSLAQKSSGSTQVMVPIQIK